MMRFWQVAGLAGIFATFLRAEEGGTAFAWDPPKAATLGFSRDLGMLDPEREDYATNLAILSANKVAQAKASVASLSDARRMLGLALQLSPRNKRAVIVNFQLSKGLLPELSDALYEPKVFARLMLTRGNLLEKTELEENKRLARYFIQLAAELDPKNEDAVYASEMQRLDYGAADWAAITDGGEKR
jgi:hypothetical protein